MYFCKFTQSLHIYNDLLNKTFNNNVTDFLIIAKIVPKITIERNRQM